MELTLVAAWLNTTFAEFDLAIMLAVHKLYEAAGWFFSHRPALGQSAVPLGLSQRDWICMVDETSSCMLQAV